MKSPLRWLVIALATATLALVAARWLRLPARFPPRDHPTAPPQPEVAIQDGKTIDFSSGRAVVKDDAKQKTLIEKSVREMADAAKDVTFGPAPAAAAEPKPAEPPAPPPKP